MKKNVQLAVLGVLLCANASSFAAGESKSTVTKVKEYIQNSVSNCKSTCRSVLGNRYVKWTAVAGVTAAVAVGCWVVYKKITEAKTDSQSLV